MKKPPEFIEIKGEVFSGRKEGAYYVSHPKYRRQFIEKLGFNPYPGTLNLKIDASCLKAREMLDSIPFIEVHGFNEKNREFGSVKCYEAIIEDQIRGAIIVPSKSKYDTTVLELIAQDCLRKKLRLKDGSIIKVRIHISNRQEGQ